MHNNKSTITFAAATTDDDFAQVLQLQQQNLFHRLNTETQSEQGFVFAEHTLEVLKSMAAKLPQVIALHNGNIVGYNLAMSADMRDTLPSLSPMFIEFDRCNYKGKKLTDYKFIVGGQVCVDKAFRGYGLMSKLYRETANRVSNDYQLCVTEISIRNTKSLAAHQKMGFEVVSAYDDGKERWNIVAWEL